MNIREKKGFVCEEDYPVVQTTEGKLRGYVDGDVFCFRGVDYAWAERFQMPETAEKLGRNPGCAGLWLWLPGDELFSKRKKPEGPVYGASEIRVSVSIVRI